MSRLPLVAILAALFTATGCAPCSPVPDAPPAADIDEVEAELARLEAKSQASADALVELQTRATAVRKRMKELAAKDGVADGVEAAALKAELVSIIAAVKDQEASLDAQKAELDSLRAQRAERPAE